MDMLDDDFLLSSLSFDEDFFLDDEEDECLSDFLLLDKMSSPEECLGLFFIERSFLLLDDLDRDEEEDLSLSLSRYLSFSLLVDDFFSSENLNYN